MDELLKRMLLRGAHFPSTEWNEGFEFGIDLALECLHTVETEHKNKNPEVVESLLLSWISQLTRDDTL